MLASRAARPRVRSRWAARGRTRDIHAVCPTSESHPRYASSEDVERGNMFKSAEEREAERRAREAEETRAQAARAEQARAADEQRKRDAFAATPVGAATVAKEAGQSFFEVQLEV